MSVSPDLERLLKPVTLLGHEQQYLTVAEALNQHGRMIPTSTDDIKTLLDNLHMQWMGIWSHHHAITTITCVCQIWEVDQNPNSLLGYKQHHLKVAEALNQHGRVPTSTDDI